MFVFGPNIVSIYYFDPVSGSQTLDHSFVHGLPISVFTGVDQITLDPSKERLFISANDQVAVFTIYGVKLGTIAGASGPGGIKIYY